MAAEPRFRDLLRSQPLVSVSVPEPRRLLEEVERLKQQMARVYVRQPDDRDLEETVRAAKRYWHERRLDTLPRIHYRRIPFVLFLGTKPHLGDDPEFLRQYLRLLSHCPETRLIRALLYVFLRDYPEGRPGFTLLRDGLLRLLDQPALVRLRSAKEKCERYGLLAVDGTERFAREWIQRQGSTEVLVAAGLEGELETRGFAAAAYDHVLDQLRRTLEKEAAPTDVLNSALSASLSREGRLRFSWRRVELAEALLLPFRDRPVAESVQDRIKAFLLEHYGHPKIRFDRWLGVSEAAQSVLLRWLVGATLKAFFDLIDVTALESHWYYRREFWSAYYDKGCITDAWIALGRGGQQIVQTAAHELRGSFGELKGGQSNQSVLLMRLSGLTIAEWSHNGSCRIWKPGDMRAPVLYRHEYEATRLRQSEDSFIHHGSDRNRWQQNVAEFILAHTGIRFPG